MDMGKPILRHGGNLLLNTVFRGNGLGLLGEVVFFLSLFPFTGEKRLRIKLSLRGLWLKKDIFAVPVPKGNQVNIPGPECG